MASELAIEDIRPGTGAEAKSGTTVTVHYVGTLTDEAQASFPDLAATTGVDVD